MTDTLVISIGADGACASLHNDNFDLGFLGDKKVYRQSDIRFNADTQKWDIVYLDEGKEFRDAKLDGFDSYEDARQTEVSWLNKCREFNLDPTRLSGVSVAYMYRQGYVEVTREMVRQAAEKQLST